MEEPGGLYNNCVREFYDQQLHGWYSVENDCGIGLHVVLCPFSRVQQFCGGLEIEAGKRDSNGADESDVQAAGGGYRIYVCREGFDPRDSGGAAMHTSASVLLYRCVHE
jgi:hypothetical protein